MNPQHQAAIASLGGKAAHQRGDAYEFSLAEATVAGKRGGDRVSADRAHMSDIGRRGALARWAMSTPEVVILQRRAHADRHGWPEDPVEFGSLIRSVRELYRISRQELAHQAGVGWRLRHIEKGRPATPGQRVRLIAALRELAPDGSCIGSSLDQLLQQDGALAEVTQRALRRVREWEAAAAAQVPARPEVNRGGDTMSDDAAVCNQCGARAVCPRMRPGRTIRYRNMGALGIPDDFPIPTCTRCRAESLDAESRDSLLALMQEEYRSALRQRVRKAIDTLSQHISQRKIERLLGLSQGYLSRLKSGAGNPSPELVSNLALLAKDPKVRLQELEHYWAQPCLSETLGPSPFPERTASPS